ncbi:hypothetical protein CRUP_030108, partial [Coryphaenoides rupestris]
PPPPPPSPVTTHLSSPLYLRLHLLFDRSPPPLTSTSSSSTSTSSSSSTPFLSSTCRLIQYLASRNTLFNLNNFLDKGALQGYDMSTFIRRYSRYLNEKALSYRLVAVDFTKMKRGMDGVMRTMNVEKLIKTLPIIQNQLDALLDF